MLKVENLTKVYESKSGKKCIALDDINLILPETGLVFIYGKSGSGKSTLLNILGGLDKPTSGEVSFEGNIFSKMPDKDLVDYRNSVIGFIFQDYCLIDNINVEENIRIPLSLQNRSKEKALISEALKAVGLEGYKDHRINDLSDGQKQRVAIARVLVKNPQIILADEPTRNLDTATTEEIFTLLDTLSDKRLIIVVTQNMEAAIKITQYLIGIKEGKIFYNNCPNIHNDLKTVSKESSANRVLKSELNLLEDASIDKINSETEPANNIKKEVDTYHGNLIKNHKATLPLSTMIKMGIGNLVKKPIKSISALSLLIIIIFSLTVLQLFFSNFGNHLDLQARLMKNSATDVFSISFEKSNNPFLPTRYGIPEYINENYPQIQIMNHSSNFIVIEDSKDILKFGYEFIGNYSELNDNSIYITDEQLNLMYSNPWLSARGDNGDYVRLTEFSPEQVVGRRIKEQFFASEIIYYTVAGIVKTDKLLENTNHLEKNFIVEYSYKIFHLKNYIHKTILDQVDIENTKLNNINFESMEYQCVYSTSFRREGMVLKSGSIEYLDTLDLLSSEIVLSLEVYNQLFNKYSTINEYLTVTNDQYGNKKYSLIKTPEYIGEEIDLSLLEEYSKHTFNSKYTLKGVLIDLETQDTDKKSIVFSNKNFEDIFINYYNLINITSLMINKNSCDDLKSFFMDMKKQGISVKTPYNNYLINLQNKFTSYLILITLFIILLSIVMIFLVINLIRKSILSRTKELGFLKVLGIKNNELFGIFFVESFILAFIPFVIGSILTFLCCKLMNVMYFIDINLKIFVLNFGTYFAIFLTSFTLIFFATLIPLKKISKLNPLEAIRVANS